MTHWRTPNATSRSMIGGNPSSGSHHRADTPRDSNSLARHLPPGLAEPNLAVVRGGPFITERELQPIEPLDPRIDHREFAALIFAGIFFGLVITAATVVMALT